MRGLWVAALTVGGFVGQVRAEEFRFSHQISLHPISPLQSVISLVPADGHYKSVRALLVLDGELLTVPLIPAEGGSSYRGIFPTPRESFSYQFQGITDSDAARLSKSFEVSPICGKGDFLPQRTADPEIRRALLAQQQRQRLLHARDLIRKNLQRYGMVK